MVKHMDDESCEKNHKIDGNLKVKGGLCVNENAKFKENVKINGDLSVKGNTSLNTVTVNNITVNNETIGNLTVTGTANVNALNVSGPAKLMNGVSVTGGETVDNLTVTGNETVQGTSNLNVLNVSGATTLNSVTVNGTATFNGSTNLNGPVTANELYLNDQTAAPATVPTLAIFGSLRITPSPCRHLNPPSVCPPTFRILAISKVVTTWSTPPRLIPSMVGGRCTIRVARATIAPIPLLKLSSLIPLRIRSL